MARTLGVQQLEQRGAVLVDENLSHQVWEFPDKRTAGWGSFYLRVIDKPENPQTKCAWWLGHNGECLARNRDAGKLFESDPKTYWWVDGALWAWFATDGEGAA